MRGGLADDDPGWTSLSLQRCMHATARGSHSQTAVKTCVRLPAMWRHDSRMERWACRAQGSASHMRPLRFRPPLQQLGSSAAQACSAVCRAEGRVSFHKPCRGAGDPRLGSRCLQGRGQWLHHSMLGLQAAVSTFEPASHLFAIILFQHTAPCLKETDRNRRNPHMQRGCLQALRLQHSECASTQCTQQGRPCSKVGSVNICEQK